MRSLSRLLSAVFLLSQTTWGQADLGIVTRKGAIVHGGIEGALQLVDDGEVQIAPGASVSGDIMVPAERSRGAEKTKPSSKAVLKILEGRDALKGEVRTFERFQLPRVLPPAKTTKTKPAIVRDNGASLDLSSVSDLTLQGRAVVLRLPPATYGAVSIEHGTLLLGVEGAQQPLRYEFRSLDVSANGAIRILSPVVVTIAEGSTWRGRLGEANAPAWLDLRVASGDVTLAAGSEFFGCLTAPKSKVTIAPRASLTGTLITDDLVVEAKGKAVVAMPDWSAPTAAPDAPAWPHRAFRLHGRLSQLREKTQGNYSAAISFIEDVPFMMINPAQEGTDSEQRAAVVEGLRLLFLDSGFERAGIVLPAKAPNPAAAPAAVRNLQLTRAQYVGWLQELSAKKAPSDAAFEIAADASLTEQFITRLFQSTAVR